MSESILDRDPVAYVDERGDIKYPMSYVRPADERSLWLVSADDLATRDKAVLETVLATVRRHHSEADYCEKAAIGNLLHDLEEERDD